MFFKTFSFSIIIKISQTEVRKSRDARRKIREESQKKITGDDEIQRQNQNQSDVAQPQHDESEQMEYYLDGQRIQNSESKANNQREFNSFNLIHYT